jgi:hypothetical protein
MLPPSREPETEKGKSLQFSHDKNFQSRIVLRRSENEAILLTFLIVREEPRSSVGQSTVMSKLLEQCQD